MTTRRWWLLGAAAGVSVGAIAGVATAWVLATPAMSSWVRSLSVCVGALVLGSAVLGSLVREQRRPAVASADLWRVVAAASGLWLILSTIELIGVAADVLDVPVTRLGTSGLAEYIVGVAAGGIEALAWLCIAGCTVVSVVAYRRGQTWSTAPVAVAAGLALIARPVTGHMAQQPFGSLLNAVHVLAAAVWFGTLLALALTVRGRAAWAELLPRYSQLALQCVAALIVTGVIDASVRLGSLGALVGSGYGRIVLAKAVVLAGMLVLAWTWRRTWVPGAATHRTPENTSLRNAAIEVCIGAVVFGLAAALATTG